MPRRHGPRAASCALDARPAGARQLRAAPWPGQVFDQYANETSVDEIFGNQVFNLRGAAPLSNSAGAPQLARGLAQRRMALVRVRARAQRPRVLLHV